MRQFISCILILFLSFGLITSDAYAKRFGGGRSFGVQRSQSSLFSPRSAPSQSAFARPGQRQGSKWGGLLGGMLVGGLLASLFMGNGLASGLLSWLLVGGVVLFLIALWRSRMQPAGQSPQASPFQSFFNQQSPQQYGSASAFQSASHDSALPDGFSEDEFLRQAKVMFIRLQAAYDQKNIDDLRQFAAPEVFAEIKMQFEERGDEPNETEVVQLNATLLNVEKQVDSTVASVRFTGVIKENNDPSAPFSEIWHFRQFSPMGEWVVGGLQQAE
jgi:predicted lipid-binding transport protein (Tim44 family)